LRSVEDVIRENEDLEEHVIRLSADIELPNASINYEAILMLLKVSMSEYLPEQMNNFRSCQAAGNILKLSNGTGSNQTLITFSPSELGTKSSKVIRITWDTVN